MHARVDDAADVDVSCGGSLSLTYLHFGSLSCGIQVWGSCKLHGAASKV